eukprot:2691364-Amphidinium_carterae.1
MPPAVMQASYWHAELVELTQVRGSASLAVSALEMLVAGRHKQRVYTAGCTQEVDHLQHCVSGTRHK